MNGDGVEGLDVFLFESHKGFVWGFLFTGDLKGISVDAGLDDGEGVLGGHLRQRGFGARVRERRGGPDRRRGRGRRKAACLQTGQLAGIVRGL
jgi:hypothetical protein